MKKKTKTKTKTLAFNSYSQGAHSKTNCNYT